LKTTTGDDSDLWLRNFHPAPTARTQLVCLPHAGGSASFFFPVSRGLAPRVDVFAVQYPGRQDRRLEPNLTDLHELAARFLPALRKLSDRPIALLGHSMGATLGFEVARMLESEGIQPARLFASGRRAPSRHRVETVHLLDDQGLLEDVRKLSGTDARLLGDEEVLRMALPAIRADYTAAECYTFSGGPTLSCPITVLTGDDDPKCTVDEAESWVKHTSAECDVHVYPGGHFFLAQHQPAILQLISDQLTPTP
jgi:surfactin synthase thioesterase subunit